MFNEVVGQAKALDVGMVAVVVHPFEHSGAEAAGLDAVLNGHDVREMGGNLAEQKVVERFGETHVVMGNAHGLAFSLQLIDVTLHVGTDGAKREHRQLRTLTQPAAATHLDGFERTTPVDHAAATTRVAYDERSVARQLCRVHHATQLSLVHRRGYGYVGHGAQGCNVERSMVCGAVFANQTSAVQTQHHGEVEQGGIVYDVVVSPLCERAVNVAEGLQTVFRHAAGEGHGVALGNAHIEHAVRHGLHHDVHGAACRHGWCHAHNARVALCQLEQRLSEHVLKPRGQH